MYCQKCGKEIPNDSNLCPYCGTSLKNQTENKPPKKKKRLFIWLFRIYYYHYSFWSYS